MKPFSIYKEQFIRLKALQVVSFFIFATLASVVAWRQCSSYNTYIALGDRQSLRRIVYPGLRGCIYDRNGKLLAGNRPRYSLTLNVQGLLREFRAGYKSARQNKKTKNKKTKLSAEDFASVREKILLDHVERIGNLIGRQITFDKKRFERHFYQQPLIPFNLANDLSKQEYATLIQKLQADSPFYVFSESVRYYPYGSAACHTIGYVISTERSDQKQELPGENLKTFFCSGHEGKMGLEAYYDSTLRGFDGGEIWTVHPSGVKSKKILTVDPVGGKDITCSLDIDLQIECEKALRSKTGAIVMMEVQTGEVLALVSRPGFNLNDLTPRISQKVFNHISTKGAWLNRATQGLYPPGSPFKLISTLAMLKNGTLHTNSTASCSGSYKIGTRHFHCHNRYGHGFVDTKKAIAVSCNPFFYKYAIECGADAICAEARRFGLDQKTGIDLPYETRGMFVPSKQWKLKRQLGHWTKGDTANLTIGQGFLLSTPLQLACVTSALARGETRVIPSMLKGKHYKHNSSEKLKIEHKEFLFNAMLEGVRSGTSKKTYIPGYQVAGKSGTSEVKIAGKNEYKHLAWSISFLPADKPRAALVVMVEGEEDAPTIWGGTMAVPIAKKILQCYIGRYGLLKNKSL